MPRALWAAAAPTVGVADRVMHWQRLHMTCAGMQALSLGVVLCPALQHRTVADARQLVRFNRTASSVCMNRANRPIVIIMEPLAPRSSLVRDPTSAALAG